MSADPAAGPGPDPAAAPHADPDRLADLAEGLLAAADAAAVRDHLASCSDCAADFALITKSFDLADLLPPEPIPAGVAARVQAALEREPALAAAPAPGADPATPTALRPRRHRFRIAFTGLAAASLLGVAVVGISSALRSAAGESKSSAGTSAVAPAYGGASAGIAISDAQAAQQTALRLFHTHPFAATPDDGSNSGASASPGPKSAQDLTACVSGRLAGEVLLASTAVSYQGQPAWLLVYRQTGDPTEADVVVVPQSCLAAPNAAGGSTGGGQAGTDDNPAPLLSTTVAIP